MIVFSKCSSLLISLLFFALFACSGDEDEAPQQQLIGSWQVSSITTLINEQAANDFATATGRCLQDKGLDYDADDVFEDIDSYSQQLAQSSSLVRFTVGSTFVFNADNSYTVTTATQQSGDGNWRLTGDQLVFDGQQQFTFAVAFPAGQLTFTDSFTTPDDDFQESVYQNCMESLTLDAITTLSRTQ